MDWDWINLAAIAGLGLFLWRVMGQRLDALDGRMDKLEDGLGEVNTKLADLAGELRGRRAASSRSRCPKF